MNELEPGCLAIIIESVLGLSVNKIVQCVKIEGEHSVHGIVWLVHSKDELVSEYGAIGNNMSVPAKWLKKVAPPKLPDKVITKELVNNN